MGRTKNYKDFNQFVKSVTPAYALRFRGMSQEDYERGVNEGKFRDAGWPPPKNGRRYSMSEFAHQLQDPEKHGMKPLGDRPHPKSKHTSERTHKTQKIVMDVPTEEISFWQKLVSIFKFNKDETKNTPGDAYEK